MVKEAFGTGATIEEAKDAAVKALNAPEDADIKYEVIETPKAKLFGIFGKLCRRIAVLGYKHKSCCILIQPVQSPEASINVFFR